ncbi:MAG: PQQ-binding-like beta-propeller repeat protein [Proteobacteria bacterium]|nr:PQQ-binding-like beta-propeller repeat protein [Pseudomonadota bacterium]
MKKLQLLMIGLCLLWAGSARAATDCDVWLGTWDMTKTDSSTYTWVIDKIVTGTSGNILCQAQGTTTPNAGGPTVFCQIIQVSFLPGSFAYTESTKLGEEMGKQILDVDAVGESFVTGTLFTDYNIKSGTKRVSGPRCGVEPTYVTGGDTDVEIIIRGKETSFDNTTTVAFGSTDITVDSITVDNATKIRAIISVADNAADQQCTVTTTTGSNTTICSLVIRGVGDPTRVAWTFKTGGIITSSPAIEGDYVYIGSADNYVYCLNRKTGEKVWGYATGNSVLSSPLISGDALYVGSTDKKLYRLNAATGEKVWEFVTGGNIQSSPAIARGRVYVGSFDDKVYCVDEKTGVKQWDFQTAADVFSTPAVADGRVYVGGVDYNLYCLDAKDGSELWRFETEGDIPPSPAVVDGYVYVGSRDGKFYCIDAETGIKKWDFLTGDIVYDSAAVSKGFVYFASLDGKVYCLDTVTGEKIWEFDTGYDVHASPAITDDYLYIGSFDGNVYCLDVEMGTMMWHYRTDSAIFSSPAVAHGLVYVGSQDTNVYCMHAPDDEEGAWPMFRANTARTGTSQGSCIAQRMLGKHDEDLKTLRLFRDRVLAKSSVGKKLINLYYTYGGQLGQWCQRYPLAERTAKHLIKSLVPVAGLLVAD